MAQAVAAVAHREGAGILRCALAHVHIAPQQLSDGHGIGAVGAQKQGVFPMFVSWILAKVRAWLSYRETVRELSQLTDRELDDLGIARFEIEGVARTHAGV
jgi:uncharacterized protein YjiS (DUF1127 family)